MHVIRCRVHVAAAVLAVFTVLPTGCVKNVKPTEKTKTEKTTEVDPPPKIAPKPDTDEFDAAVAKADGDVEQALTSIGAYFFRNAGKKEIEAVDLSGKKLTTAGIGHLTKLQGSLQRISLNDVYVTGDGLKVLVALPHLRKLELNRTPITDDALAQLAQAAHLRELSLRYTGIGDAGLKQLAGLTDLRQLSLSGTKLTDAGLAHLVGLPKLTTLILEDTEVTDEGLKTLLASKSLQFLHLAGTKVTPAGVGHFRRTNPKVEIFGQ